MDERDLNPLSAGLPDASIIKAPEKKLDEPRVKAVTTRTTELKKKPWYVRVKDSLFYEDSQTIMGYIIKDVILPSIRDVLYDTVTGAMSMALYSTPKASRGSRRSGRTGSIVSYDGYYSNDKTRPRQYDRPDKYRTQVDLYNILLEDDPVNDLTDYEVGMNALKEISDCMRDYHFVRVQDLVDCLKIGNVPATLYNWGWDDVSKAAVEPEGDRWYFRMHSRIKEVK